MRSCWTDDTDPRITWVLRRKAEVAVQAGCDLPYGFIGGRGLLSWGRRQNLSRSFRRSRAAPHLSLHFITEKLFRLISSHSDNFFQQLSNTYQNICPVCFLDYIIAHLYASRSFLKIRWTRIWGGAQASICEALSSIHNTTEKTNLKTNPNQLRWSWGQLCMC